MTTPPKILLTGANGQLGRQLAHHCADLGTLTTLGRQQLDLTSPPAMRATIRRLAPDIILNAAAYTAVDRAETDAALAMQVNADAPRILAEEAARCGALFVHYSTDYVFDGSKSEPWLESDAPAPLNVYGQSKRAGELEVERVGGRYLIFRTSWVYDAVGKNFLHTMLRLAGERSQLRVVSDQVGAPTSAAELARATAAVLRELLSMPPEASQHWYGLYHMSCAGSVSWAGFAQAIFHAAAQHGFSHAPEVIAIRSSEYPTAARRPLNSVLSNEKLRATFGVSLARWQDALDATLSSLDLRATATSIHEGSNPGDTTCVP